MERWARHAGLTMRELIGMHYNPLTRQYRLGRGVDVNYIAYTTREN
jgi:2-polyprenyl-6-hydroxyphenyl methylase/3-demethylubiquinone-9 3-methyltransferase